MGYKNRKFEKIIKKSPRQHKCAVFQTLLNNNLTALTDESLSSTQLTNNSTLSAILTDESGRIDENITVWDKLSGVFLRK